MNMIYLVQKNLKRKEEKIMKKIISLFTMALFAVSVTCPANAGFISDGTKVLNAEVDLSDYQLNTTFDINLRNKQDGSLSVGNSITWQYEAGKMWKTADQYIEIVYTAGDIGWGIQIYTDNTNDNADPQWIPLYEDAVDVRTPEGLVADRDGIRHMTIPLSWKAFPGKVSDREDYGYPEYVLPDAVNSTKGDYYFEYYTEPNEISVNDPGDEDYYTTLYQYSPDPSAVDPKLYGKYCWLIDKSSEKWLDGYDPLTQEVIDANKDGEIQADEIVPTYEDASDVNSIVNFAGVNTCNRQQYKDVYDRKSKASEGNFTYTMYLVMAAKIGAASIKATYSTSTLTLELYHE